MRRRVGIYGASDEALALIPLLAANPGIDVVLVYDPAAHTLLDRMPHLDAGVQALLEQTLTDDPELFGPGAGLDAVIDATPDSHYPQAPSAPGAEEIQVLTPLTARLLWGYGGAATDHKADLLQALHEVIESYNLTIDLDELFTRMLEIALGATGAEGGSLMLLDPEASELRVRVAVGVEPELWPKIRVALGEGIAGRVAAEARPLRLRGRADRQRFQLVRERMDVESALCVPLEHAGHVLGVLNLHHSTRPDAFSEADLAFVEDLAQLDAQIIARAQEHDLLRSQAARYTTARRVQELLSGPNPLADRLTALCRFVAGEAGQGIANVYLHDPDEDALRLAATSLSGAQWVGEVRVNVGEGIDGRAAETGESTLLLDDEQRIAYAALPLLATDRLIGVLSVQVGEAGESHLDADRLSEIADEAAHEIAQADREARVLARANKMNAINEAGLRMISTPEPNEVLRLGSSSAAMVLEADHAVLRLQDPQTQRFVIRSYFGSADGVLQERLFRLDRQVSLDVLKRRDSMLVREVERDPLLRAFDTDVRSLIVTPLRRDGRLIGTLALYDKIAADRFLPGRFSQEDLDLFGTLGTYVARALDNAFFRAETEREPHFDDATGLPNALYLEQRLQQEIARAGARRDALTVVVARIDNAAEIERAHPEDRGERVVTRLAESLRARSRDFDVVGRLGRHEFAVLLPEPGAAPSERVTELARAVADDISKDDALNEPRRISLVFGYASVPDDGSETRGLLERAREPRIQMV